MILFLCCRLSLAPPEQEAQEVVDWDELQIIETIDGEVRLEVASEEQLYVLLGLRDDGEKAQKD